MIALPPAVLAVDGSDLPALSKAVAACDRLAVAKSVADETRRHGTFLLDSFTEQQAIAAARSDWAERRRKLRASAPPPVPAAVTPKPGDAATALALTAEGLDDRQRALDDARLLDRLKQDALGWFRQLFITSCQGKST